MDASLGNTSDSNVAFQGNDLLQSVTNGSYTVDATAPTVSITAPSNGASNLTGNVTVTASAADTGGSGLAGVQFKLDGVNLGAEDVNTPFSITWNASTATNGTHILTATARDGAGNLTTSSNISVTVNNADTTAPTVSLTAPAAGPVTGSAVTVSANAADNIGVAGVQFKLDGANLGAEDVATPFSISWNTTTSTDGVHSLTATARDAAGNTTTSTAVSVTVNNTLSAHYSDRP